MKMPIHYSTGASELDLPASCDVHVFSAPEDRLKPVSNDHWLKKGDLPKNLRQFLEADGELLIVVNDQYRPTPTATVLKRIVDHLSPEQTTFLVATALHEAPDQAELRVIFGDSLGRFNNRVKVHDAFSDSELVSFSSQGKEIRLNRLLADHQRILTIGSVEPHYFAGFTGGRKIFLPGCSSFADTRANHALALSSGSRPLATSGNPVWEDIVSRTACLNDREQFSIQLVAGHSRTVLHAAIGKWDEAFEESRRFVVDNFAHGVTSCFDIVICVVHPPLDRNLYQLQKSYENVAETVRNGGSILLVSGCDDGVGDGRFLKLAAAIAAGGDVATEDPESAAMGIHKVVRTRALAGRIDLLLVSRLEDGVLQHLPIQPRRDLKQAVRELLIKYGDKCKLAVVLDSASQVLYRKGPANADSALTMEEKDYA